LNMQRISCRQFNKVSHKHRVILLMVFSTFFFFLVECLSVGFFYERWHVFQSRAYLWHEFIWTEKFIIFLIFQLSALFLIYVSLRPAFAFDEKGVYIKPRLMYSSVAYFIPWKLVEEISRNNGRDEDGDQYKKILITTNLVASTLSKFRVSFFYGSANFDQKDFCFDMSFSTSYYQEKCLQRMNAMSNRSNVN